MTNTHHLHPETGILSLAAHLDMQCSQLLASLLGLGLCLYDIDRAGPDNQDNFSGRAGLGLSCVGLGLEIEARLTV